jgi:hypothetical protein
MTKANKWCSAAASILTLAASLGLVGCSAQAEDVGTTDAELRSTGWTTMTAPGVQQITVSPSNRLYGIGSDGAVYEASGMTWVKVSRPWVTKIAVTTANAPGGTWIYGIGTDRNLYRVRPSVTRPAWTRLTNVGVNVFGSYTEITVDSDGVAYALRADGQVERVEPRTGYGNAWLTQVTDPSGFVTSIEVGTDGLLYGLGTNGRVYRTETAYVTPWQELTSRTGMVTTLALSPENDVYGLGTDGALYRITSSSNVPGPNGVGTADWVRVLESWKVPSTNDGLVVAANATLYWVKGPGSGVQRTNIVP